MRKAFHDNEMASRYAKDCLLFVDGRLMYCEEATTERARFLDIEANCEEKILFFKKIDIKVPTFRYINMFGFHARAVKLMRYPYRVQKIGPGPGNVKPMSIFDVQTPLPVEPLFKSTLIVDAIRGRFPTIADSLSKLRSAGDCVAFSKDFAILLDAHDDMPVYNYFFDTPIGRYKPNSRVATIEIAPPFTYLRELMESQLRENIHVVI